MVYVFIVGLSLAFLFISIVESSHIHIPIHNTRVRYRINPVEGVKPIPRVRFEMVMRTLSGAKGFLYDILKSDKE